jgi:acyl carrier protein
MEERIKKIMALIFEIDIADIKDDSSPDTIEKWVSLKHMNMIVALEEEFGVTFREDEIVEMIEYKIIYETIKSKDVK